MLHNKKAILDEAARSVRRTFIGSVAGSLGMLLVVGAAGAYGMPERLTVTALAAAIAGFNTAFPHAAELAKPITEHVMPFTAKAPAPETTAALPSHETKTRPVVTEVRDAPAVLPSPQHRSDAPAASVAPAAVPAPLVFEQPRLEEIKPLAPLPKIKPVTEAPALAPGQAAAAEPQPAKPAETRLALLTPAEETPAEEHAAEAPAVTIEFPKLALLPMPPAKPPLTPAQRLDLQGKDYDRAERCLAQAIYFEARNEPSRGQMAVAQVVLNRVFSPHYPKDICSVVYQNAHHYLGCQFTFACDGKSEAIREYGAWARANRIARGALAAKIWLPEVAKATHYHAAYVRPRWVREMRVMVRYGLHTFYRPRNWGDGSNEPAWGAGAKKAAQL
jgi:spore germination cell wall hydrolase CwlJ-like protein